MPPIQDLFLRFALAILLGGLFGTQREIRKITSETYHHFGGLRTYAILSLFGAVSAYLYSSVGTIWALLIPFVLVSTLVVSSYIHGLHQGNDRDLLSELVALLTFVLGALCILVPYTVPVIISISITALVALKGSIRQVLNHVNEELFMDAIKFAIVAFVILPLIPNQTIDPWGIVNPFSIWFFVVVVSAISFVGYVIAKIMGPGKGIILTGLIGGLASSTAATLHLSALSKKTKGGTVAFVTGIILATMVMFVRLELLILVISESLALNVLKCVLVMFLTAGAMLLALRLYRKHKGNGLHHQMEEEMDIKSSFRVLPAIKFGLIFLAIQILEFLTNYYFGDAGIYLFSAFAGLADADPPAYIIATKFVAHTYALQVATIGVILAVLANGFTKSLIPLLIGRKDVGVAVMTILMVSGAAGVLTAFLW